MLCNVNAPSFPDGPNRRLAPSEFRFWLGFLIVVGGALRFFRLGTNSFWLDEAASAVLARVDRHVFVGAIIHRQANMVLYYLLLRGWIRLGSSEFVIRGLSVVAGVAAIPAIYVLGTRLFGPKAGRVAALLLSVHAFHVEYSQEARAYSLFMLLAVMSWLFLPPEPGMPFAQELGRIHSVEQLDGVRPSVRRLDAAGAVDRIVLPAGRSSLEAIPVQRRDDLFPDLAPGLLPAFCFRPLPASLAEQACAARFVQILP